MDDNEENALRRKQERKFQEKEKKEERETLEFPFFFSRLFYQK
jgi:hypothetical protein